MICRWSTARITWKAPIHDSSGPKRRDAARGKILDNLGRVLVSNRVSYQVTLDTSLMGTAQQRNEILMELLDLCREQGVTWSDTLPVTAQAPFTYTSGSPFFTVSTDDEGVETKTLTRLGKLAVKLEWLSADPPGRTTWSFPRRRSWWK